MLHSLSEDYWAPHPQTGVFGPPTTQHNPVPSDTSGGGAKEGSVLELKVWFRHVELEDPEKPHSL
ncbi:Late embryogenesis abundant protein, partial [Cucurbita argyrosperma subsp. argyrosperma]